MTLMIIAKAVVNSHFSDTLSFCNFCAFYLKNICYKIKAVEIVQMIKNMRDLDNNIVSKLNV